MNSIRHTELFNCLIDKGENVNQRTNTGWTALPYAIDDENMDVVRQLLRHGSDPFNGDDRGDDAVQKASLEVHSSIFDFYLMQ